VIVAHAQKVELITKSNRKDDRSAKAQIHLTVIRVRAELVSARTALVNAASGLVKPFGERLPKCGTRQILPPSPV
jgi:hypothetical protein